MTTFKNIENGLNTTCDLLATIKATIENAIINNNPTELKSTLQLLEQANDTVLDQLSEVAGILVLQKKKAG